MPALIKPRFADPPALEPEKKKKKEEDDIPDYTVPFEPCIYECGGNDNDPNDHLDGCPKKGRRPS